MYLFVGFPLVNSDTADAMSASVLLSWGGQGPTSKIEADIEGQDEDFL